MVDDHDDKYGVPTLEELGFECDNLKQSVWVGGETEALSRYTALRLNNIRKPPFLFRFAISSWARIFINI